MSAGVLYLIEENPRYILQHSLEIWIEKNCETKVLDNGTYRSKKCIFLVYNGKTPNTHLKYIYLSSFLDL